MKVEELREQLQGILDGAEVEIALISKDGQRQVLRRVAKLDYRFEPQEQHYIVALIGYKSLRQQREKVGDLKQEKRKEAKELQELIDKFDRMLENEWQADE